MALGRGGGGGARGGRGGAVRRAEAREPANGQTGGQQARGRGSWRAEGARRRRAPQARVCFPPRCNPTTLSHSLVKIATLSQRTSLPLVRAL